MAYVNNRFQLPCDDLIADQFSDRDVAIYLKAMIATSILIGIPSIRLDEERAVVIATAVIRGEDISTEDRRQLVELVSAHVTRLRRLQAGDRVIEERRRRPP